MSTVRDLRAGTSEPRAKHLRPQWKESGVFKAVVVHEIGQSGAAANAQGSWAAPRPAVTGERLRSGVRKASRAEVAAALTALAARLGLNDSDIGSAIDEPRQRVAEMRAGERAVTMDHMVLIARRLPVLFAALTSELFGEESGQV